MSMHVEKPEVEVLAQTVYPSTVPSVSVSTDDTYKGAHEYTFRNSLGFSNGEAQYDESYQTIKFVKKGLDGTMEPGVQSEQLVIALLDRVHKLNAVFPSPENAAQEKALLDFLAACKKRIDDRINRGVMGDLKK